jgi:hypothetical protein
MCARREEKKKPVPETDFNDNDCVYLFKSQSTIIKGLFLFVISPLAFFFFLSLARDIFGNGKEKESL